LEGNFRVLGDLSEAARDAMDQFADMNLRIAADNLKRVWLYISLLVLPYVAFLISKDLWRDVFGWSTIIAGLVILIWGVQSYSEYKLAFLIKTSVECYMQYRSTGELLPPRYRSSAT
jgi:hypothetical protein